MGITDLRLRWGLEMLGSRPPHQQHFVHRDRQTQTDRDVKIVVMTAAKWIDKCLPAQQIIILKW